jgi:hypothetical protein
MGFNDQFALCLQQRKPADFDYIVSKQLHRDRPQATVEKSLRADLNRSCLDGVCHLLPTESSPKRSCSGFYDAHRALGLLGPTCGIATTANLTFTEL